MFLRHSTIRYTKLRTQQDSHDNLNIITFLILVVHNSMFNHISKILIERHAVKTRQVILLFIFYLWYQNETRRISPPPPSAPRTKNVFQVDGGKAERWKFVRGEGKGGKKAKYRNKGRSVSYRQIGKSHNNLGQIWSILYIIYYILYIFNRFKL